MGLVERLMTDRNEELSKAHFAVEQLDSGTSESDMLPYCILMFPDRPWELLDPGDMKAFIREEIINRP